jgi:hypothetical protein
MSTGTWIDTAPPGDRLVGSVGDCRPIADLFDRRNPFVGVGDEVPSFVRVGDEVPSFVRVDGHGT